MSADKLFILSPEHTRGTMTDAHNITHNELTLFDAKTPVWLKNQIDAPALLIPGGEHTKEILLYTLQQDKVPEATLGYGYAGYKFEDILCLSIPKEKAGKPYMYYNALFALWDVPALHQHATPPHHDHHKHHHGKEDKKEDHIDYSKHNPLLEIERKIYNRAKDNGEDMKQFIKARIWFLTWLMEAKKNPKLTYSQQLLATIGFLEGKK